METFGRGCLYLIIVGAVLMVLAIITRSTINIPWFILIPLIIAAFWIASRKSKK